MTFRSIKDIIDNDVKIDKDATPMIIFLKKRDVEDKKLLFYFDNDFKSIFTRPEIDVQIGASS